MKLWISSYFSLAVLLAIPSELESLQSPADGMVFDPIFEQAGIQASHGTLVVVLATPRFIVAAADSRQTFTPGDYHKDDSKKLFAIGKKRVLTIAGLAGASVTRLPGLTAQVAPLLDRVIARQENFFNDDDHWNDAPPPDELDERFRKWWGIDPYMWWNLVRGPIQTIFNIRLAYGIEPNHPLIGLLAGFKDNGDAKIERLVMVPGKGLSTWGRPYIGVRSTRERFTTSGHLIWKTAGQTQLADMVLGGNITEDVKNMARKYPSISAFLDRRRADTVDTISEGEMIALSKDLIRATAELTPTVGREPIQIATLRPKEEVVIEQPSFPQADIFLSANGTWHLGTVFTPDFPFDKLPKGVVYTFCEIKDNKAPIPLGDNHFYGNTFEKAVFVYNGGMISFDQNKISDSKLIIAADVDESSLVNIRTLFKEVVRVPIR